MNTDMISGNLGMLFLIVLPLAGGVAAWFLGRKNKEAAADIVDIVGLAELICMLALFVLSVRGTDVFLKITGFSGLTLSLKMDWVHGMTGLPALIIFLALSTYYKGAEETSKNKYQMYYLFSMGMTVGLMLSSGLVSYVTFISCLSVTVFPLFMTNGTEESKKAASSYFLTSVFGILLTVTGMTSIVFLFSSLNLDSFYNALAASAAPAVLTVCALFLVAGLLVQTGAIGFGWWLPAVRANAAGPVNALYASVLTRAAMFGLLTVTANMCLANAVWGCIFAALGILTALWASLRGIRETEPEKIAAWLSTASVGILLTGISAAAFSGLEQKQTVAGVWIYLLVGMLSTAGLSMCASSGKHVIGSVCIAISGLTIIGVPFFGGYEALLSIYQGFAKAEGAAWYVLPARYGWLLAMGMLTAVVIHLFVTCLPKQQEEKGKLFVPLVLVILPVIGGILPKQIYGGLLAKASDVLHVENVHDITMFAGEHLLTCGIYVIAGAVLYVLLVVLRKRQ